MQLKLLIPRGNVYVPPISSSSFCGSSGSSRQSLCFKNRWSENALKVGHSNVQQTSLWTNHRRRDTFCLTFTARAIAVKQDEANSHAGVEVTETKLPHSRVRLNVKVPPSICREVYDGVVSEVGKRAKVPGFRPGKKVPEQVLVDFVGKHKIQTAAIEAVLNRTLPEAMSSVAGRALRDSEHILTKFDELHAAFSTSGFFCYDVAVDLAPEIKWTTNDAYKNLKVVVEIESDAAIERAAEAELNSRYKDLGSLRIVQDRGLQIGDIAILDVSAVRVKEDGTDGDKLPFTEQKGFHLDTQESTNLIPGFVDAILGLQTGQTRSFKLAFPATWKQEDLRGVLAHFMVECKELFYRVLPDLDDTLADELLNGCSSLGQVRESLLRKHRQMAEATRKQAVQSALIQELTKIVEIDVPHSLLEEQGRQLYGAKLIQLQTTMKLTEDQILTLSSEKAVNNYLLTQKERIEEAVKQALAVEEIFQLENLQYSKDELEIEVEKIVAEFKQYNYDFDRERIKEQAEEALQGEVVFEWLIKHANITYVIKGNIGL